MSFNPGDRVQVKSGGPVMTVEHVNGDSISCVWFEKTKQYRDAFPAVVLVPFSRRPIRVAF